VEHPRNVRAAAGIATIVALTLAAAAPAATRPTGFRSPSGNISCLFVPAAHDDTGHLLTAQLLCSIVRSAYSTTLQDRCLNPNGQVGAGVDWHGFSLGAAGRGSVVCSGGILYAPSLVKPSYVTLRYGATMRRGEISCRSQRTGVTCHNRRGHGLFVSRETWRVW
jgi:hypothetical protein